MANNEKLVVTTYIINKGQPSQYFGLKTLEGDVLHYAPNNWKTEQGAYAWAKKKGYIVKDTKIKDNTFDNVKQVYTAQDKNGKVYYVYEGDYKDYKGTRHIFAVSSQTPEYVKSERNVAGTILPTKEEALKQLKMTVRDDAVGDSISKYNGEDAIRINGFVKIKEDGDWTSYKYNGSDFDGAVFKIHQYNPSLIAFVSNGNRTITVRNKYLKDSYITDTDMKTAEDIIKKYGGNPVGNAMGLQKTRFVRQDEIKNQHDFAIDLDKAGYKFYLINGKYRISPKDSSIKDDLTMVEKYKKSIIYIDDNGYYYHTPIGGRGAKAQKDNTKDINIVKKRIDNDYSFLYDSAVKDVSYVSGKNLKIGQKIVEDGEVLEVVDIKETQRGVNNNYRNVTFKNVKTGATETVHFGNSTLARLNDYSPKYNKGQKIQTSAGIHEIIGYDPVRADVHTNRIEYSYRLKTPNGTYTNIPDWQLEELVKLGRYKLIDSNISDKLIQSSSKEAFSKNMATEIKSGKDPKQAAAIAYSVQKANDSISQYKPGMDTTGLWQVSHIKNNINQSLLVRANSKEEAINKVVKHSPNSKIIGVNEYPIPHFGEPILDSGFVDAKDRFYKVGTKIKEGNNILVVVKVDDKYVYLKHPNGKTYAYDPYDLSENLKMSPKWSYVDSAIKDVNQVLLSNLKQVAQKGDAWWNKWKKLLDMSDKWNSYQWKELRNNDPKKYQLIINNKQYAEKEAEALNREWDRVIDALSRDRSFGRPGDYRMDLHGYKSHNDNYPMGNSQIYDKILYGYEQAEKSAREKKGLDSSIKDAYIEEWWGQSGENPNTVARRYGVSVKQLKRNNDQILYRFEGAIDKLNKMHSDGYFMSIDMAGNSIKDSSIKDAIVNKKFRKGAGSDIRALCIKNDWYTSGTISDYDKLLTGVDSGWTVNEAALDIAKHSNGVKPIDVVHAIEQYDNQRHFLQDSRVKDAKPYSIKYKNKQYKVYAKDEQTAVEKLNNLLNKVTDEPIK